MLNQITFLIQQNMQSIFSLFSPMSQTQDNDCMSRRCCFLFQMGKKIRYQILRGSLLMPMLRYTMKLSVGINPVSDPRGSNMARYWHQIASQSDPQFKQPNFQTQLKFDYKSVSAYMVVDFVNGWKHGFFFKNSTEPQIHQIYDEINDLIEFERTLQGFEDEYQDEVAG